MLIYIQMIETAEEQSKFEEIYKAYRGLMYHVAFQRMQNVQDAVQHVFIKIAENIEKIEPVSPKTKQLIVTMVNNRVTDVFRIRKKHPVTNYQDELSNRPIPELEGEDLLTQCISTTAGAAANGNLAQVCLWI